jgi:hypothetical protein
MRASVGPARQYVGLLVSEGWYLTQTPPCCALVGGLAGRPSARKVIAMKSRWFVFKDNRALTIAGKWCTVTKERQTRMLLNNVLTDS